MSAEEGPPERALEGEAGVATNGYSSVDSLPAAVSTHGRRGEGRRLTGASPAQGALPGWRGGCAHDRVMLSLSGYVCPLDEHPAVPNPAPGAPPPTRILHHFLQHGHKARERKRRVVLVRLPVLAHLQADREERWVCVQFSGELSMRSWWECST